MQDSPSFDFLDSRYFVYADWFVSLWFVGFLLWIACCWIFRVGIPHRKAGIACFWLLFPIGTVLTFWRPVVDQILRHAVLSGDVPRAHSALSLGAGVNGCTNAYEDETPSLQTAISQDNVQIVRLLIAHGANVNDIVGGDSRTLDCAERRGQAEIIRMLRNAGAVSLREAADR